MPRHGAAPAAPSPGRGGALGVVVRCELAVAGPPGGCQPTFRTRQPREHPAGTVDAWHGGLNAAAPVLLAGSLPARLLRAPDPVGRVLGLRALGLVAVSGWLGGHLVYRLGWREVPAEHTAQLEAELRRRGDTGPIERAHRAVREYEDTHALIP